MQIQILNNFLKNPFSKRTNPSYLKIHIPHVNKYKNLVYQNLNSTDLHWAITLHQTIWTKYKYQKPLFSGSHKANRIENQSTGSDEVHKEFAATLSYTEHDVLVTGQTFFRMSIFCKMEFLNNLEKLDKQNLKTRNKVA